MAPARRRHGGRPLDNVEELAHESGEDVEGTKESLGEMQASIEAMRRRVLVIAEAS